jgi:hypothetical protein
MRSSKLEHGPRTFRFIVNRAGADNARLQIHVLWDIVNDIMPDNTRNDTELVAIISPMHDGGLDICRIRQKGLS